MAFVSRYRLCLFLTGNTVQWRFFGSEVNKAWCKNSLVKNNTKKHRAWSQGAKRKRKKTRKKTFEYKQLKQTKNNKLIFNLINAFLNFIILILINFPATLWLLFFFPSISQISQCLYSSCQSCLFYLIFMPIVSCSSAFNPGKCFGVDQFCPPPFSAQSSRAADSELGDHGHGHGHQHVPSVHRLGF